MLRILDSAGGVVLYVLIMIATFGAWIQHFMTTFDDGSWFVMALGGFIPPIGMVHGWLVWIGIL